MRRLLSMFVTLPGCLVRVVFLRAETQDFRPVRIRLTFQKIYILYGCFPIIIYGTYRKVSLRRFTGGLPSWWPIYPHNQGRGPFTVLFLSKSLKLPKHISNADGDHLIWHDSSVSYERFGSHRFGVGPVCTETYWAMYHMSFNLMNQLCLIFLQTYFNIVFVILAAILHAC